jgi:branched-chain amino acid transport system ATP-binding protein
MLVINDLSVAYGAIQALKKISLEVKPGEIVTLIGANGAGKTTTLQAISRLLPIKEGEMFYEEQNLNKLDARSVVKLGISQVPEGRRIFPNMTVLENLQLGAYLRNDQQGIQDDLQQVYHHFPILAKRQKQLAGTLSGGEQQMLAMGRALMSRPKLILLDEPSMGLAPMLVKEIFNIIQAINAKGTTVLLVEQNARMALSIANRAYVLENGVIVMSGNASELLHSEEIKKAYLGG